MRKFLSAVLVGGAIATASVAAAGVAEASPPPPSPQCSIVVYPLVFLIEATGGSSSPFVPVAQALSDAVCR